MEVFPVYYFQKDIHVDDSGSLDLKEPCISFGFQNPLALPLKSRPYGQG